MPGKLYHYIGTQNKIRLKFVRLKYPDDIDRYKKLISSLKSDSVLYNENFLYAHRNTKKHTPFVYGIDQNDELEGLIAGILIRDFTWPISILTSRAIVYGNPIIKDNDPNKLEFLLTNFCSAIKYKAIYTQVRPSIALKPNLAEIFLQKGFKYHPHLNISIDLELPIDQILNRISKNKRRNIVKSTNKGVTFRRVNDLSDFVNSLITIKSTYKRIKLPLPHEHYFIELFKELNPTNNMIPFVAEYEGKIIGTRIMICSGSIIYDWYAGALNEHANKYTNDFLIVKILIWASQNGYSKFDFGGAGSPNKPYGVREHKMKFGGELYEVGRYQIVHQKLLYSIGRLGLFIFKRLQ